MSLAHLDIGAPSMFYFLRDCAECGVDAQKLLDSGEYVVLNDGWVMSKQYAPMNQLAPMDMRPTAWESRLNIWRQNIETFRGHQFEEACLELITDTPLPTAPMHELVVSDLLGMYCMGEEL